MKTIAPFQAYHYGGELILTSFISPESRIMRDTEIIAETISNLPEHEEARVVRTHHSRTYAEERGSDSMKEFFLFENLEFDTQRYSHSIPHPSQGVMRVFFSYLRSVSGAVGQAVLPKRFAAS